MPARDLAEWVGSSGLGCDVEKLGIDLLVRSDNPIIKRDPPVDRSTRSGWGHECLGSREAGYLSRFGYARPAPEETLQ